MGQIWKCTRLRVAEYCACRQINDLLVLRIRSNARISEERKEHVEEWLAQKGQRRRFGTTQKKCECHVDVNHRLLICKMNTPPQLRCTAGKYCLVVYSLTELH